MLPSVAATTDRVASLERPCFVEMVVTGSCRNRSSPPVVATQILPSRSSKRLQLISPESPSAFANTSVLPLRMWTSPRWWVPIQRPPSRSRRSLLESTLRSGEQAIAIGRVPNRIGLELVSGEPQESSAAHPDQHLSVVGPSEIADPHSRRLVASGRAGFPAPDSDRRRPRECPSCPRTGSRRMRRRPRPAGRIARGRFGWRTAGPTEDPRWGPICRPRLFRHGLRAGMSRTVRRSPGTASACRPFQLTRPYAPIQSVPSRVTSRA